MDWSKDNGSQIEILPLKPQSMHTDNSVKDKRDVELGIATEVTTEASAANDTEDDLVDEVDKSIPEKAIHHDTNGIINIVLN